MITQSRRFILLLAYLFFMSFLTVGCDQLTKFFQGEDSDEKTKTTEITAPKEPSAAKASVMPADGIVQIEDWVLTKSDFQDRINALKEVLKDFDDKKLEARKMVLDEIISQQLIVKDAKEKGLDKQPQIAAAVDEFEKTLLVREDAKRIVAGIKVTEEDAKTFYNENPDNFKTPEEWKLREIVVPDQLKANELLLRVIKGEDFASIAKENSTGEFASKGGDMGFVANVPFFEMANAIANLEEGGVSNVFKGPDGYYIIKVEEKRGGQMRSFDEVKDQLQKELVVVKQQKAILDYVKKLKENVKIEINEANLE